VRRCASIGGLDAMTLLEDLDGYSEGRFGFDIDWGFPTKKEEEEEERKRLI
jgi:hypothetical protein